MDILLNSQVVKIDGKPFHLVQNKGVISIHRIPEKLCQGPMMKFLLLGNFLPNYVIVGGLENKVCEPLYPMPSDVPSDVLDFDYDELTDSETEK